MFSLDAQRALELLQQYRAKLDQRQQKAKQGPVEEDHQLQQSLDKVINVFQSQLFSALLGKKICFGQLWSDFLDFDNLGKVLLYWLFWKLSCAWSAFCQALRVFYV